ncbi:NAD(P)H-binding protein [Lacibacter sediminis]|uniref:NAD(P)H-binding protein n=1 Tax=Lacibacter sediminis TaxID=2760713 RepID=A0A7G5XL60_9BACT|nr:NAD(P)H-binding protein [Lacibacter sediminis]QNA46213.1 NAD(P)H-binding protein [Lacibacter sediminis]
MKKILIIGAGGSLAQYVIEAVKQLPDTSLTLFVRNRNRLSKNIVESCSVFEGDAMNFTDVKNAVKGQDIIYVNLSGDLEAMAKNIVKAMQETGVKRIVAISSIGIYDTPLRSVLIPYRKLADVIEASGLDYTILRPDWFTNGNEIDYALTQKGEPETGSAVSRKSIAAFISSLVENPWLHKKENLGISKP